MTSKKKRKIWINHILTQYKSVEQVDRTTEKLQQNQHRTGKNHQQKAISKQRNCH